MLLDCQVFANFKVVLHGPLGMEYQYDVWSQFFLINTICQRTSLNQCQHDTK